MKDQTETLKIIDEEKILCGSVYEAKLWVNFIL